VAGVAVNQISTSDTGLEIGDIIVAIGERKILRASDVPSAIHMVRPGQSLDVEIIRGGNRQTLTLVLSE
jgi:serine protease Do